MPTRVIPAFLGLCAFCAADTITLRSGGVVEGSYLGGDARNVRIAVGDRVDSYPVSEISTIQFTRGAAPKQTPVRGPDGLERRTYAAPAAGAVVPAGSALTVKVIDPIDSDNARVGQTYRASVEHPVVVDGQTVIPQGSNAIVKLLNAPQAGPPDGGAALTLDLAQVQVNGRLIEVAGGAALTAGAPVVMKGAHVRIPAETLLTFTLRQPLRP